MHQLTIAGKAYRSRLLVGTGKYKDFAETRAAMDEARAMMKARQSRFESADALFDELEKTR